MRDKRERDLGSSDDINYVVSDLNPNPVIVFEASGELRYANEPGADLHKTCGSLFQFLGLSDGSGSVEVGLMWQNRVWAVQSFTADSAWYCYFSEVTSLRKMYQQTRYLATFAETNPSPVIDVDESGQAIYVNQAAEDCFSGVRFLGLNHSAFQHLLTDRTSAGRQSVKEICSRGTNYMVVATRLNHGWRIYATDVSETQILKTRLSNARLELVQRLSQASEWRDNETGAHIKRMSAYCRILAKALGMGDAYAEQIELAASMHDIGKIAIPDSILHKPGKLTPEEFEVMKQHAEAGGQLLEGADDDLMKMARDIAYFHHERWDGKGYPRGLAAEEIPLSARIAAVCDVFDALISERPYKKAWTVEDALKVIEEGRDSQFEGRLVDAFVANLDKVIACKDTYTDSLPTAA